MIISAISTMPAGGAQTPEAQTPGARTLGSQTTGARSAPMRRFEDDAAGAASPASQTTRRRTLAATGAATGLTILGLLCAACQTTTPTETNGAADAAAPQTTQSPAERLEATLVIGPAAARELGYRIAWETGNLTSRGGTLAQAHVAGDSIFTLDTRNLLCRVRTNDGSRIWASPIASAADRSFGLVRIESTLGDRLHVTTESAMWVVDATTGVPTERHALTRSANTNATFVAGRLVYATRAGQIVWVDPVVGHPWRVRQVDGAIRHAPIVVENEVAVVSGAGNIMVVRGDSAEVLWTKELLAGVAAAPTGANDVLFVAGLDQYLWAFDLLTGRTLWKNFNDAGLQTSPVLIGDHLYQRLANAGLVCFEAFPVEAPDGRRLWTNAEVRGEVIGRKGRNLLVWDSTGRRLTVLDAARGRTISTVDLPNVDALKVTALVDGDLLAHNRDGRLIRLVPQ